MFGVHDAPARSLTEIRDLARRFAADHIFPVAAAHDADATYPHEVMAAARQAGLYDTVIPAEYGGPGLTSEEEVTVAEEFGYACSGITTAWGIPVVGTVPLLTAGTEDQKQEFLGAIVDGATPGFALTEPGGGSDVGGITTTARRRGNEYIISGQKRYISTATAASFFTIFAKTDPTAGNRGISAFLVGRNTPGLRIVRIFDKMGHRAYDTSELELDEVVVPASRRIGAEGDGFRLAMAAFDRSRPAFSAAAVGLARRALDEALAYAAEREAFNAPIIRFQAVSHKLADIEIGVEAGRQLCLLSAREHDAGRPNVATAAKAKAFCTDLAMRATTDAVQIFGAAGIMRHNPVEKLQRDAKVMQIYEGTNEIQRNIIVRELLRDYRGKGEPSFSTL